MRFRAAIMTDLKMVVTRYRQRPPNHQEPGEADPLERWMIKNSFLFAHKMVFRCESNIES